MIFHHNFVDHLKNNCAHTPPPHTQKLVNILNTNPNSDHVEINSLSTELQVGAQHLKKKKKKKKLLRHRNSKMSKSI